MGDLASRTDVGLVTPGAVRGFSPGQLWFRTADETLCSYVFLDSGFDIFNITFVKASSWQGMFQG